ncbi:PA0069 family radical SAM protein [Halioxenophilus sp. WMMB6]|uniref:PA0069 family radical SAM protein n=1 Tax=Halioxenophilus sp. WMMB6 TaxID=3073815 RepID=UPI00295F24CA|nr:PA0069 family radical SAM protein [Halioxenophilus sp. WMMB6]
MSDSPIKGRGTASRMPGRFSSTSIELIDGQAEALVEGGSSKLAAPPTEVRVEQAKSLITRNSSPDVPFSLSINPYRGCEHGCIYCFARPTHAYLELSPGLDFETKLIAKANAAELFARELRNPNYRCETIALGVSTDPYQPIEKSWQLTRQLLAVANDFNQPLSLITKSGLILRDLDLLAELAAKQLISVAVSVTTLDNALKRLLEPRASSGEQRLHVIRELTRVGVPVTVLLAPVIPFINDHELETIVAAVGEAGARAAAYIMLRLPNEVLPLFREWLLNHYPDRAQHVLNRIADLHQGKLYDSRFGKRMTGEGVYAELINKRFNVALKRAGIGGEGNHSPLNTSRFQPPPQAGDQLPLW